MEQFCKLCQQFGESIVKEEIKPKNEKKNEMERHVEVHRLQLRLANGFEMSETEIVKKCFPKVASNALVASKNGTQFKEFMSAVCQDLFPKSKQEGKTTAPCFECGADLKIFYKGRLMRDYVVNHATSHLGKPLFECRRCDTQYVCKSSLKTHMRIKHQVTASDKSDYNDSSADYQNEIAAMIKRCFGRLRAACDRAKRKNRFRHNSSPLSEFCHQLVAHWKKDSPLQCQVCQRQLRASLKKIGCVETGHIIEHACSHLKQPMFNCRTCEFRASTKQSIKLHLRQIHKLSTIKSNVHYEDLSNTYLDEIKAMMRRCYEVSEDKLLEQDSQRFIFSNFCRALLANMDRKSAVLCFECGVKLRIFDRKGQKMQMATAVNHACLHLKKLLFACRHCDKRCQTKTTIMFHLRNVHNLSGNPANYVDSLNSYQKEIINMMKLCFEPRTEQKPVRNTTGKINRGQNQCLLPNFCRKIFGGSDASSPAECTVCLRQLRFFCGGRLNTRFIIDHASSHLKKGMFSCRQCDFRTSTKTNIVRHLRQQHDSALFQTNCKDLSGDYLDEIKAMIMKCFGTSRK